MSLTIPMRLLTGGVTRNEVVDQAFVEEQFQHFAKVYRNAPTEILLARQLEMRGGDCPVCHVDTWRKKRFQAWYERLIICQDCAKVLVDDQYCPVHHKPGRVVREGELLADFWYYEPVCVPMCFKRCTYAGVKDAKGRVWRREGCGRIMVEEKLLGYETCLNCGGIIL